MELTSGHSHQVEKLDPIQNHLVPSQELFSPEMAAESYITYVLLSVAL